MVGIDRWDSHPGTWTGGRQGLLVASRPWARGSESRGMYNHVVSQCTEYTYVRAFTKDRSGILPVPPLISHRYGGHPVITSRYLVGPDARKYFETACRDCGHGGTKGRLQ